MEELIFELNKSYLYDIIEKEFDRTQQYENDVDISMEEYGNEMVGEHFVVFKYGLQTTSFVLTGSNVNGYIYKCIYKD